MTTHFVDYHNGITTIDAQFIEPGIASIHLIEQGGQFAFVDTGTTHSLPVIREVMQAKNISADQVVYVIVTHVHLDHAGGAGAMMLEFPYAKLVVHPLGARHMVDPSRLVAGTIEVYGADRARQLYGKIAPIDKSRVIIAEDGFELDLHGRRLRFLDTPGHARHHFTVLDQQFGNAFTGDTMGISYRTFDSARGPFLFPTTSPVQCEPDVLHGSIDRLMQTEPRAIFLTHFGRITPTAKLIDDLHRRLTAIVDMALGLEHEADRESRLIHLIGEYFFQEAKQHGAPLTDEQIRRHLAMDTALNAQGLDIWLKRRKRH
jgi:glyoxylase-like metal-dependent hydrolase (beta-lactamase superfamily II)